MRVVRGRLKRFQSALLAVLLVVQAVLAAWHGAAMAKSRLSGVSADGSIVICTAHGSMRVMVDGALVPVDPAGDPGQATIKCPLCLALSADVWVAPLSIPLSSEFGARATGVPHEIHLVAHAPRAPPQQRGPPSLV